VNPRCDTLDTAGSSPVCGSVTRMVDDPRCAGLRSRPFHDDYALMMAWGRVALVLAFVGVTACSSSKTTSGPSATTGPPSTTAQSASTTTTPVATGTRGSGPSTSGAPPTTNTTTGAVVPPLRRALDLNAGTAFGFDVGDTSPESVAKALTPVLGPPTRDTGVYVTHIPDPEGCFGNQQNRIVRWGNLAYMFWHPGGYVLSAWTLGSTKDLWAPLAWPEPRPVIEEPAIAATTADGLGIGSPVRAVRKRYALQPSGPHLALVGANPVVSPVTVVSHADGVVTGIGRAFPVCA
jgi:hypothetical protein